jgi:hypothetical protein
MAGVSSISCHAWSVQLSEASRMRIYHWLVAVYTLVSVLALIAIPAWYLDLRTGYSKSRRVETEGAEPQLLLGAG